MDRLTGGPAAQDASDEPELIELPAAESLPSGPTLEDLLQHATECGVGEAALHTAARHYCGTSQLDRPSSAQITDLLERMEARYGSGAQEKVAAKQPKKAA